MTTFLFDLDARRTEDEKTTAERQWKRGSQPSVVQQPCDFGLFSDDHLQRELDFSRNTKT